MQCCQLGIGKNLNYKNWKAENPEGTAKEYFNLKIDPVFKWIKGSIIESFVEGNDGNGGV